MTERDEFAIPSCNANGDGAEEPMRRRDTGMRVTQAREESLAPQVEEPNFVTVRSRGKRPDVTHESDAPPEESKGGGFPTPFTEDSPSPRCVVRDYAEGAAHFGHDAPALAAGYWTVAAIPLAVRLLVQFPLDQATQRPGRFWACVAFTLIVLALAGVL